MNCTISCIALASTLVLVVVHCYIWEIVTHDHGPVGTVTSSLHFPQRVAGDTHST